MPPRLLPSTLRYLGSLEETCYCNCRNGARQASATRPSPYITSAQRRYTAVGEEQERPRWQHTPRDMVAPVRLKTYKPENEYRVNQDPKRLDQVYEQVLGHGGSKMLTEDVKWLAVTHKSFDQGRRGYNDRLAFFGKRIVDLQTSLALLKPDSNSGTYQPEPDPFGREHFEHPALETLPELTERMKSGLMDRKRLADIAERYGLLSVLRWKPKKASDLKGSGVELALAQALYAIVGAVSLQRGGEVAARVIRERIISKLIIK